MTRTRIAGILLLLCIAGLGWHLIHRTPAATPSATASPGQTTPAFGPPTTRTDDPQSDGPTAAPTAIAVTPHPPNTTPVRSDVPQDGSVGPRPIPGPEQRQVEAEEPPVDLLTDAQLQTALERLTAGQARLQPDLEQVAAAAAWQQVQPTLAAANTWSHIEQRAAVALLIGQHTDPTQPIPVNVIITWSGTDPDGVTGVHRAESKLLYVDNTWQPLN